MATKADSFSWRRAAVKRPDVLRCAAAGFWRRLASAMGSGKKLFVSRSERPLRKVLVVVEGQNDVEFLRRMSAIIHSQEPAVPD